MRGGIEGWDHPTGDYELAKICAATGELDSAYIYLEQAVDEKYLRYGLADFMTRDPVFEDLVGQPRFVRLAEQAKARVAAERQKVRAYEMSGEIPGDLAGFGIL